jgi:hypothetical protein
MGEPVGNLRGPMQSFKHSPHSRAADSLIKRKRLNMLLRELYSNWTGFYCSAAIISNVCVALISTWQAKLNSPKRKWNAKQSWLQWEYSVTVSKSTSRRSKGTSSIKGWTFFMSL